MTKILVADDHPMIRTALEALLRDTEFAIVGTAGTGEAALREVERLGPDILLLDLQMPDGNGMDVLRRIRAGKAKTPLKVVLLTAAIDDSALLEAKSLKVQGIVLKNSDPAYLLDCLDHVRHGRAWFDPELTERAKQLARTPAAGGGATLTPREHQLIGFVRTGLRNREIAERLGVTEGTIKTYLHAVFEKLGVSSRTELAIRAEEFLAGQ
ncbi:response regulator transcription factor [Sphingomonas sp.]|uniref:response regulator transcription factor n=1 Tax=Sphingomonas sp. TaxID=28214 RepID=UPI00286C58DE|nr:response regulator transcription factor [Sphingomonas sp.]